MQFNTIKIFINKIKTIKRKEKECYKFLLYNPYQKSSIILFLILFINYFLLFSSSYGTEVLLVEGFWT